MKLHRIVGLCATLMVSAPAWADVPPPAGYVEQCTPEIQQTEGRTCELCTGAYHGDRDYCTNAYAGRDYERACRTRGASAWSEVWCTTGPAPTLGATAQAAAGSGAPLAAAGSGAPLAAAGSGAAQVEASGAPAAAPADATGAPAAAAEAAPEADAAPAADPAQEAPATPGARGCTAAPTRGGFAPLLLALGALLMRRRGVA